MFACKLIVLSLATGLGFSSLTHGKMEQTSDKSEKVSPGNFAPRTWCVEPTIRRWDEAEGTWFSLAGKWFAVRQ